MDYFYIPFSPYRIAALLYYIKSWGVSMPAYMNINAIYPVA
jgi:hypothetical protein